MKNNVKKIIIIALVIILTICTFFVLKRNINNDINNDTKNNTYYSGDNDENISSNEDDSDPFTPLIYGMGDFNLKCDQVYVLNDIKNTYDTASINITEEELISKLGEPDVKYEDDFASLYTYKIDNDAARLNVTVRNDDKIVIERFLLAYSNSQKGVKLSQEVDTIDGELINEVDKIREGMSFEEVRKILGENYMEIKSDYLGQKGYKWYDKYENSFSVFCDKDGIVYAIDLLGADGI